MTNIYLAYQYDFDSPVLLGCFSSLELAKEACELKSQHMLGNAMLYMMDYEKESDEDETYLYRVGKEQYDGWKNPLLWEEKNGYWNAIACDAEHEESFFINIHELNRNENIFGKRKVENLDD